jgi:hypothetical protein
MRVFPPLLVVVASPVDAWRRLYRVRGSARATVRGEEFFGQTSRTTSHASQSVAVGDPTLAPLAAPLGGNPAFAASAATQAD